MTAIIVKGLTKGNFSIWQFYLARIRRIFPALMVLISSLLLLGWFLLPTPDYQALAAESTHALSFSSNIYYWLTAGYFDSAAREKWLLHTWSLAIEFQFYVIFPIILTVLWYLRPRKSTLWLGLSILFVISLVLNNRITPTDSITAFYMLPTRGWELSMGGLALLLQQQHNFSNIQQTTLHWLGWGLFLTSLIILSSEATWIGNWAFPPVLATALIILANQQTNLLTINPITQWLGDCSYSLYLWHWPLVVALGFANLTIELPWIIGAMLMSLLFAHLSYMWVEVPTRRLLSATRFRYEIMAIGVSVIIIASVAMSVQRVEFTNRMPANVELAVKESLNYDSRKLVCHEAANETGSPECIYGTDKIDVPKRLGRAMLLGQVDGDIKILLSDYQQRNVFVWSIQDEAAASCGATILNPLPYLCDKAYCYGSRDGQPWYFDDDHLSEYGNRLLLPMFTPIFAKH